MQTHVNYLEHSTTFHRYLHGTVTVTKYYGKIYACIYYPFSRVDKPW